MEKKMKRTTVGLCLTIAGILSLAACANGDTTAEELSAEPATGTTIAGDGYTYVVPEGWTVPGDTGFDLDSVAMDSEATGNFASNVNVLLSPGGKLTADEVEEAAIPELESVGATDVTVHDRLTIAGSESAHLSAQLAQQGVEYVSEQYYLSDEDQTYVVTFSFAGDTAVEDRRSVAESVLVTWEWAE